MEKAPREKWVHWSMLSLLDDAEEQAPDFVAWQGLFRSYIRLMEGNRVAAIVKTAAEKMKANAAIEMREVRRQLIQKAAPPQRNLREMMVDYNKHRPTQSLIKKGFEVTLPTGFQRLKGQR